MVCNDLNVDNLRTLEEDFFVERNMQETVFELEALKLLKGNHQILISLFLTCSFHLLFYRHRSLS